MKILSIGSIYLDINSKLEGTYDSLKSEVEYKSSAYETKLGGSAVIAPLIMTKLHLESHFVGIVGSDVFGDIIKTELSKSGIIPHLEISPSAQTNVGINRIDDKGNTFMDVLGDANSYLQPNTLEKSVDQMFNELDLLYLGSIFKTPKLLPTFIKIATKFKLAKKLVFLDHGRVPNSLTSDEVQKIFKDLLPYVTHYAPSGQDIESAWNLSNYDDFIKLIIQKYPSLITNLKLGENGSLLISNNMRTSIKPHGLIDLKLNPNFVGAGDACNAGLIYGISNNLSPIEASKIANQVAYLNITRKVIENLI